MKSQKYNHITRVLLAVGLFSMAIPALAAQVPPGTVLAEKQGLVSVSPAGEIQPRLAEKWENKDNTVWTFHLRPGVTWSDGTAITAQDIVWSWQRLVSPLTASPYASYPGRMRRFWRCWRTRLWFRSIKC